jgi:hypothetical protein
MTNVELSFVSQNLVFPWILQIVDDLEAAL